MSKLTEMNKNFDVLAKDFNFWQLNPQLALMKPFSALYNRDTTKGKEISSKEISVVFFMCEVDDEVNKFARIPKQDRLAMLKETFYADIDIEDPLIVQCMDEYPMLAMSAIERALKEEIDSMVQRARFIEETQRTNYTLDDLVPIGNNRWINKKGTATQLDAMRKNTPAIYKNYEKLEEQFLEFKKSSRVKGGRKESLAERGIL